MAKKKKEDDVTNNVALAETEDKEKKIELAKKAIIKKYGDVLYNFNDDDTTSISTTISTGSLSLDLALGNGGLATGRIYEIYGPYSSGKSTCAQNVIVQAQRRGMRCCYVDAEHSVDVKLLRAYGVAVDDLDIAGGYDAEENLDILESLIKTGGYKVAVVDSVSALVPRAEAEADIDKDSMALQARIMSKALRKLVPIVSTTDTVLIFTNQIRMKVGMVFGNPEVTSGGGALGFYSTGRIAMRGGEARNRRILDSSGETIGHRAEFEVVKNKLYAPFRKAEISLIYGSGYDIHQEIIEFAVNLGIIDKTGAWYKYEGNNIAQGEANMVAFLKNEDNTDFFNNIRKEVLSRSGLGDIYESYSNPGPLYT